MLADDIDVGFVPRPHPAITSVTLDGEIVLYDDRTLALHLLNNTAAAVWERADGSRDVQALIDDLANVYSIEPEAIAESVVDLVRQLAGQELLDGIDQPDPSSAAEVGG
jgi:hypothetical protein